MEMHVGHLYTESAARPEQTDLTDHPAGAGEAFTHGAALAVRRHRLLAVVQQFALDLIADGHTAVADAHATGLGFPDVVVFVDHLVHGAAAPLLLFGRCGRKQGTGGTFHSFTLHLT